MSGVADIHFVVPAPHVIGTPRDRRGLAGGLSRVLDWAMSNLLVRCVRRWLGVAALGGALMAPWGAPGAMEWPQFRGPGGVGVAAPDADPPLHAGPGTNVLWKVAVPSGNSSPIITGDQVFLTGFEDRALLTLAYDRRSGRELWRAKVAAENVEEVHRSLGSPASSTPATDGERVYAHFGSFGMVAFDLQGREVWRRPMALTQTEYGASSSPVVVGDLVVQLLDQDGGSHLVALQRLTGEVAWRVERPEMRRGFGTPILWNHDQRTDLVVPGTIWLKGFDPLTGSERWRVSGLARITCTSPAAGDGLLFTASWTTGGDRTSDRITMPDLEAYLREHDTNHDGKFSLSELPEGPVRQRFKHLDGNRDGFIARDEWESMSEIFQRVENQAFAVKPDGRGGVSDGGVLWRFKKGLPYVASPVYAQGRFYMVKNGGMLTCLDPVSGRAVYQEERLGAVGDYYASLVAADGRIYAASQPGVLTVVKAGDRFEILARHEFGETLQATPAMVGKVMYLRTMTSLYAFREGAGR